MGGGARGGGAGGGVQEVDVQTSELSWQPLPQHLLTSDDVQRRMPLAEHSAAACNDVAKTPLIGVIEVFRASHTETQIDSSDMPQQRTAARKVGSLAHTCGGEQEEGT